MHVPWHLPGVRRFAPRLGPLALVAAALVLEAGKRWS
jgi:hypothetical protein